MYGGSKYRLWGKILLIDKSNQLVQYINKLLNKLLKEVGFSEMSNCVFVGGKAPEFTLPDQNGKEISLGGFKGKNVVLLFYPLDWTPV